MDVREIPRQLFSEFGIFPVELGDSTVAATTVDGFHLRIKEIPITALPNTSGVVHLDVFWYPPKDPCDREWLEFSVIAGGTVEGSSREQLVIEPCRHNISLVGSSATIGIFLLDILNRIAELLATGAYEIDGSAEWVNRA